RPRHARAETARRGLAGGVEAGLARAAGARRAGRARGDGPSRRQAGACRRRQRGRRPRRDRGRRRPERCARAGAARGRARPPQRRRVLGVRRHRGNHDGGAGPGTWRVAPVSRTGPFARPRWTECAHGGVPFTLGARGGKGPPSQPAELDGFLRAPRGDRRHGADVGSAVVKLWDDELEALRPELREEAAAFIASIPWNESDAATMPVLKRVAVQRSAELGGPPAARAVDRTIEGPSGPIRLRTLSHEQPEGVLFHIHGGAWLAGSPEMMDLLHEIIVDQCHLAVVSVDYRLAPEHPYPAG